MYVCMYVYMCLSKCMHSYCKYTHLSTYMKARRESQHTHLYYPVPTSLSHDPCLNVKLIFLVGWKPEIPSHSLVSGLYAPWALSRFSQENTRDLR